MMNTLALTTEQIKQLTREANEDGFNSLYAHNIPDELRARSQWVTWQGHWDEKGKLVKIPHRVDNPRTTASSTDPSTWGSFEQAFYAWSRGDCAGIGYVFSKDDPYVAIDIDKCIGLETGTITEEAQTLVNLLDSYTEQSISNTGLHVILKGKLPNGGKRKGSLEIYEAERFFLEFRVQNVKELPNEERNC
jgi:putative DNA primase/helicase